MNRRTKIIAAVFALCVAYVLVSAVVYPAFIEPLMTIDERIAAHERERAALEEKEARVFEARLEYRDFLDRVGSFDELVVQNDLRQRLNTLIEKHNLESASTSPSRPQQDGKTGITSMAVNASAVGTLESVINFLKDVSELPGLVRIGNASIYPASASRAGRQVDRVNLRVPIEVWVLPQHRMLGERIADADLAQPEVLVRHGGRDYSAIWKAEPFTEFIPLDPLVVDAGPDVKVEQGRRVSLNGIAKGGDGQYTFEWSPTDGLSNPSILRPSLDTAEPGGRVYTLTVKDNSGNVTVDQVEVAISEKVLAPRSVEKTDDPPPPPPPPPDKRWQDRKFLQIRMALMRRAGDSRVDEMMVYNTKSRETFYYQAGTEFDGGTLVCVHPRGGVVRRDDEYFVYPIGSRLDQDLKAEEAEDYPVLRRLAQQTREIQDISFGPEEPPPSGGQVPVNAAPEPEGQEVAPGGETGLAPVQGAPAEGAKTRGGTGQSGQPANAAPAESNTLETQKAESMRPGPSTPNISDNTTSRRGSDTRKTRN